MDRQDGWMDACIDRQARWIDRPTGCRMDGWTDRQNGWMDRQKIKQTDRAFFSMEQ